MEILIWFFKEWPIHWLSLYLCVSRRTLPWDLMFDFFLRRNFSYRVFDSLLLFLNSFFSYWVSCLYWFIFFNRESKICLSSLIWMLNISWGLNLRRKNWLKWRYLCILFSHWLRWRSKNWFFLFWTALKHVVLKNTNLFSSVREIHLPIPMLNTFTPLAFINTSICPIHFSVSVSFVI